MNDRGFCPPNTIGKDFSNNFVQQETIQSKIRSKWIYKNSLKLKIRLMDFLHMILQQQPPSKFKMDILGKDPEHLCHTVIPPQW